MAEIVKEPVTVSYKNCVPTFTVKIKDFDNKMKTWPLEWQKEGIAVPRVAKRGYRGTAR